MLVPTPIAGVTSPVAAASTPHMIFTVVPRSGTPTAMRYPRTARTIGPWRATSNMARQIARVNERLSPIAASAETAVSTGHGARLRPHSNTALTPSKVMVSAGVASSTRAFTTPGTTAIAASPMSSAQTRQDVRCALTSVVLISHLLSSRVGGSLLSGLRHTDLAQASANLYRSPAPIRTTMAQMTMTRNPAVLSSRAGFSIAEIAVRPAIVGKNPEVRLPASPPSEPIAGGTMVYSASGRPC